MLRVQICLGAVGAGKFPIGVFCWDWGFTSCAGGGCGGASGGTGKDAAATLGSHHMRGLILAWQHLLLLHEGALPVWGIHSLLRHDASCRHGPQDGRGSADSGR